MGRTARVRQKYESKLAHQSRDYERELTDQRFHEVGLTQAEHRAFHEREHILYDDSIEKASGSLEAQLRILDVEVDRLRLSRADYLTTERFDREHKALMERLAQGMATISDRVQAESNVSIRQGAQQDLLDKLSINSRWLIGVAITSVVGLLTSTIAAIGLVLHYAGSGK